MFLLFAPATHAAVYTYLGYLNDKGNAALVSSDLSPASFDPTNTANNVALYALAVMAPGLVDFTSQGYALGGINPYFSLFQGAGLGAGFIQSNYAQAGGGDFSLSFNLTPGVYQIALGAFENMSFAENNPAFYSTLGDGFIGLGSDVGVDNPYFYDLQVSGAISAVSEPAGIWLLAAGLAGIAGGCCRERLIAGRGMHPGPNVSDNTG